MEESENVKPSKTSSSTKADTEIYTFASFSYHETHKRLLRNGKECTLEPKMAELFSMLFASRPNLVPKEELISALWPDTEISDWSLAKLVSDTRKLIEDDGTQQKIIKTIRGKGFAFIAEVEMAGIVKNAPPTEGNFGAENSNKSGTNSFLTSKTFIFVSLIVAIIIVFGVATIGPSLDSSSTITSQPPISLDHQEKGHRLKVMKAIQRNLKLTKTAFIAQARRRNELGALLMAKQPEAERLSWEARFRKHYPTLTEEEKFIFEHIRAMTEGPLNQGNSEILSLLNQHPEVFEEIDVFFDLNNHLQIWKSKYDKVFLKRKDMCLVYVGVEEGVPFPSEVDALVDSWIRKNEQSLTTEDTTRVN
ncbi:MAG: winged helix-turn-helix domain-containing protein [Kangiellaceae bacterium]|nr:winged helix-turn-helix domain-containing protein [Kangiellaceae bacterium]MCW9001002.1 winged helix-turn-helix domain-containing protein [Kangiellaceae bacterium]MCW9017096.1 winged helix-turn-helix domain-containing protein [Kangiellaceae bacterium]